MLNILKITELCLLLFKMVNFMLCGLHLNNKFKAEIICHMFINGCYSQMLLTKGLEIQPPEKGKSRSFELIVWGCLKVQTAITHDFEVDDREKT